MSVTRFNVEEDRVYVCTVPHDSLSERMGVKWYQHILAFLRPVNEGAMFEFVDPIGGHVVGCVGCNKVEQFVSTTHDFLNSLHGTRES